MKRVFNIKDGGHVVTKVVPMNGHIVPCERCCFYGTNCIKPTIYNPKSLRWERVGLMCYNLSNCVDEDKHVTFERI